MRRLRYSVAVSLDGFIAGPNGEFDWIIMDPAIDFAAMFEQFDTAVMGRKTYEIVTAMGEEGSMSGLESIVFSRTLAPTTRPGFRIVNDDPREVVTALKGAPGRDVWLFGGGNLCRTLLDAGLVDTIEVAVMPVVLGEGIPLVAPGGPRARLVLGDHKVLPGTGIVVLSYALEGARTPAPQIGYLKTDSRSRRARPASPRGATRGRSKV